MKSRGGQSKTVSHTAGNKEVSSGIKGLDFKMFLSDSLSSAA